MRMTDDFEELIRSGLNTIADQAVLPTAGAAGAIRTGRRRRVIKTTAAATTGFVIIAFAGAGIMNSLFNRGEEIDPGIAIEAIATAEPNAPADSSGDGAGK